MTGTIASLWRYPIKAHGRESVQSCQLHAGQTLPGDRIWAVAHQKSKAKQGEWSRCGQFTRACNSPTLMAIELTTLADHKFRVTHPDLPTLEFDPDTQSEEFLNWLAPIMKDDRFQPSQLIKAPSGRGMTDAGFASITLCNSASHRSVEQRAGIALSQHRWRGNIWIDGLAPWEEFDLIGKTIQLGRAKLKVIEPTTRCNATSANPKNGLRDVNVLSVLAEFGHEDFSVQTEVVESGEIRCGDTLEIL